MAELQAACEIACLAERRVIKRERVFLIGRVADTYLYVGTFHQTTSGDFSGETSPSA